MDVCWTVVALKPQKNTFWTPEENRTRSRRDECQTLKNLHEYLQVFMCKILVLLNSIINVLGCCIGSTNVERAP